MASTFTDTLIAENEPTWSEVIEHRFVRELLDGSIDDEVMAGYLVQDHRFLDSFLVLLGAAVTAADTFDARLRLARFTGEIAGGENTYFVRAFEALGVTEHQRETVPNTAATSGFQSLFRQTAATGNYVAILAVLVVTERMYQDWAGTATAGLPDSFVHAEWIMLHDNRDFRELVGFLCDELDRAGPANAELARDYFNTAVALELDFFNQAYAAPLTADTHGEGDSR